MRVFVAVEINNSDIIKRIKDIQTKFIESLSKPTYIRLVDANMLHFTLQFLGEISDTEQTPIAAALSTIEFAPFNIEIKTIGAFPSPKVPKIVWVGTDTVATTKTAATTTTQHHSNNNITELAQKVSKVLEPLGHKRDKPFKPHSTIFRVKMREQSLTDKLSILKNTTFGIQRVKEIKLKKSQLTPKGPIYTDLAVIKSRDE